MGLERTPCFGMRRNVRRAEQEVRAAAGRQDPGQVSEEAQGDLAPLMAPCPRAVERVQGSPLEVGWVERDDVEGAAETRGEVRSHDIHLEAVPTRVGAGQFHGPEVRIRGHGSGVLGRVESDEACPRAHLQEALSFAEVDGLEQES